MRKIYILLSLVFILMLMGCSSKGSAPTFEGISNKTIEVGESFDPLNEVTAIDKEDGDISKQITIQGNYNTNQVGSYTITYDVSDSNGNETKKSIILTVNPKPVGSLKGTITWKYNDFVGNKPDTNANVVLIPKNADFINQDMESFVMTLVAYDKEKELGILSTKVNGIGQYEITNIPSGEYYLLIRSANTTRNFNEELLLPSDFTNKFSTTDFETFKLFIELDKFILTDITITTGETLDYSYDFGYTYI